MTTTQPVVEKFIQRKSDIDQLLARVQQYSDDHFGVSPDHVNWADVGSLNHIYSQLKEISDSLFCDREEGRSTDLGWERLTYFES